VSTDEQDPNAVANQLHINVERYRVMEGLFQPGSILGVDQAGLTEAIEEILRLFPLEARSRLLENVFVTGGVSRVAGLRERLETEIRAIAPSIRS